MKIFTRKEMLIYILVTCITIYFLKSMNYEYSSLNEVLFHYDKNYFSTIFSLVTYFILIYFVSKNIYSKLMEFNLRFSNRKLYFKKCLFHLIILDLLYTFILFSMYIIIFDLKLEYQYIELFFKLSLQLYFLVLFCLVLSFVIKSYSYSFLTVCLMCIYFLLFFKNKYIPFISLYVTSKNVYCLLLYFVLNIILYCIYLRVDLGGSLNEDYS